MATLVPVAQSYVVAVAFIASENRTVVGMSAVKP